MNSRSNNWNRLPEKNSGDPFIQYAIGWNTSANG